MYEITVNGDETYRAETKEPLLAEIKESAAISAGESIDNLSVESLQWVQHAMSKMIYVKE